MNKDKTVFRIRKSENFVIIDRHLLEDERLTYEARGLLACMLSKPNNWVFYLSFFIKGSPAGRDKVRKIFRELLQFGYLAKSKHRDQKGKFSAPEYIVHESPCSSLQNKQFDEFLPKTEKPSPDNPSTDSPSTANRPLLSKHSIPRIQNTKNTPNQSTEFIWAKKLSKEDRSTIHHLLVGVVDIDFDLKQLLLDELAGQLDWIKNPVGYFRTLLKSCQRGEFIPDKGLQIQASRNQRQKNELLVERTQQYHEEQMLKKVQKHLKK